jgi:hypothetical protein
METARKLYDLLTTVAQQLPSLITLFGCMIVILVRWKRQPRVSLVVMISLSLLFLHSLFFAVVYNWVPGWLIRTIGASSSPDRIDNLYLLLGVITYTAWALPFALLLAGIFMQRKPAAQD